MQDLAYTIIAAEFNKPLVDEMVAVALEECRRFGLVVARTIRVPGGSIEPPRVDHPSGLEKSALHVDNRRSRATGGSWQTHETPLRSTLGV